MALVLSGWNVSTIHMSSLLGKPLPFLMRLWGSTPKVHSSNFFSDSVGECINYSSFDDLSWGDIIEHSYRIISFFDLAGHERFVLSYYKFMTHSVRYSKTTVSGMTGQMPDYCFLVVSATTGATAYVFSTL